MAERMQPTPAQPGRAGLSRVTVAMDEEGLRIRIVGERARQYNIELLESAANCLVECTENCMGETNALRVLEMSFYSFVGHAQANDCFANGFGLLPARGGKQEADAGAHQAESTHKRVAITRAQDGVEARITGPLAQGCDAALCEGVLGAVLNAIERHNCVTEQGLLITKDFLNDLVVHNMQHSCISRGLGLLPKGAAVSMSLGD